MDRPRGGKSHLGEETCEGRVYIPNIYRYRERERKVDKMYREKQMKHHTPYLRPVTPTHTHIDKKANSPVLTLMICLSQNVLHQTQKLNPHVRQTDDCDDGHPFKHYTKQKSYFQCISVV